MHDLTAVIPGDPPCETRAAEISGVVLGLGSSLRFGRDNNCDDKRGVC
jgi:hypothetical protein